MRWLPLLDGRSSVRRDLTHSKVEIILSHVSDVDVSGLFPNFSNESDFTTKVETHLIVRHAHTSRMAPFCSLNNRP